MSDALYGASWSIGKQTAISMRMAITSCRIRIGFRVYNPIETMNSEQFTLHQLPNPLFGFINGAVVSEFFPLAKASTGANVA